MNGMNHIDSKPQHSNVGLTILVGLGFVGLLAVIVSGITLASSMVLV